METPETILAWGRETFGEPDVLGTLIRANKEVSELVSAIFNEAAEEIVVMEVADVEIVLAQAAELLGVEADADYVRDWYDDPTPLELALVVSGQLQVVMIDLLRGDSESAAHFLESLFEDLRGLSVLLGLDYREIRDRKMKINRSRSWARTQEGHYQHVAS